MAVLMKDVSPLSNLKIKVKKTKDIKKLQELYKNCSESVTDMLEMMNSIADLELRLQQYQMMVDQKKKEIKDLEDLIVGIQKDHGEATEKAKALDEESLQKGNNDLLEALLECSLSNIDKKDRDTINTNIKKTGTFKGKDIKFFLETDLTKGFDIDFVDREILIKKPSPMLSKVLMAKEYEDRNKKYLELKGKADVQKQSTVKGRKQGS